MYRCYASTIPPGAASSRTAHAGGKSPPHRSCWRPRSQSAILSGPRVVTPARRERHASNRATERALSAARECAEDSGDRASLGLLAYRTSGYLTKKRRHRESIDQLLYAVEAALITGNYDGAQAYCNDLGSVIHRLGPKYYQEARSWLLLGIAIARWMKIGRDDAHGELILGKIYTELGKQAELARFWLDRMSTRLNSSHA